MKKQILAITLAMSLAIPNIATAEETQLPTDVPVETPVEETSAEPATSLSPEISASEEPTSIPTPSVSPEVSESTEPTLEPTEEPTAEPSVEPTPVPQWIDVTAKGKDNKIILQWNDIEGASFYMVSEKKDDGFIELQTVYEGKAEIDLEAGESCEYKVTALSEDESDQSLPQTILAEGTIEVTNPSKVKDLRYTVKNSKSAILAWNKTEGATEYNIYKKGKLYKTTKKLKITVPVNKSYSVSAVNKTSFVEIEGQAQNIKTTYRKTVVSTGHSKYSYAEMIGDIRILSRQYSEYCHYRSIGNTVDNRNLWEVTVGNLDAKKSLLVMGALHAREYMTSQLCMKQIEYYLQNYNKEIRGIKVSKLLNIVNIKFIPMVNPDGVTISQYGLKRIRNRKLRTSLAKYRPTSRWKSNARGVDLNNNYPITYIANHGKRGSSGYSGPRSASELETQAIIKWVNENKSKALGIVNYHAMGSIVFGDTNRRMNAHTRKWTTKMYRLARSVTGYASSAGYGSGGRSVGNFREYVTEKKQIPCITLEIGYGGCPLSAGQFGGIWSRNATLPLREAYLLRPSITHTN